MEGLRRSYRNTRVAISINTVHAQARGAFAPYVKGLAPPMAYTPTKWTLDKVHNACYNTNATSNY